jgi:hypothetical protein
MVEKTSARRRDVAVWAAGLAVVWAAAIVFIGVGMMTSYFAAYLANLPVVLLQAQASPWVTAGAVGAALLLVAVPIRFMGMPREAWRGVPIGQLIVLVAVSIGFVVIGPVGGAFTGLLGSDVPMALLATAGAFAGSRVREARRLAGAVDRKGSVPS